MATHEISLEVPQLVAVMNKDIEIVVREDDEILGRLRISKGSIDWIPRKAKYARRLSWSRFDALVEEQGRKVPS